MTASFRRLIMLLVFAVATAAMADEVHLRNGQVLKGTVTVMEDAVKIDLEDGTSMLFPSAEVDRIVQSKTEPTPGAVDPKVAQQQAEAARLIEKLIAASDNDVPDIGKQLVALGEVAVEALAEELARAESVPAAGRFAHALSRIGTPGAERALIQATLSPKQSTRAFAAEKLTAFAGAESAAALIRLVQFDDQDAVRIAALKALALRNEWMAVPVACGALESSAALRSAAVKTLVSIKDPAALLYLYSALKSDNGTVAAAAWSVFESIAAPYQAAYASWFFNTAHEGYNRRARAVVQTLRNTGPVALISLLRVRDPIIEGQVSVELMGASGGQRFGRDQDAWYVWARDQAELAVAVVKFDDGPAEAVSSVEALFVDRPPWVPIEKRVDSALPPAIPNTRPPEMRADDLLGLAWQAASKEGADVAIGITGSKLRPAAQPIAFGVVQPGRSAVVSTFHFEPDNNPKMLRRTVLQVQHAVALLLRLPPCPDNEPACPAGPVSSVDALDKLTLQWSKTCEKNFQTGQNVLRMRKVGAMREAAQALVEMNKGHDDAGIYRDAALDCERGIYPEEALKYWDKCAAIEKDPTLRRLEQERMEALRKVAEAIKKDNAALGL